MELEPLLARLAQAEKDIAELRSKVFFLEAINVRHQTTAPSNVQQIEPWGVPIGDIGGVSPEPQPKLSPFSLTGKLRPRTYEEEALEEVENPYLENLNAEMFDGNS